VAKLYSDATYKAFERQLANDGMKSILKTQSKIQKNLAEHIEKLAKIKEAGGYSSSVEREIKTFQSQLAAIADLLK
jgi:predicted membrane-bound spermidine synthase